MKVTVKNGEVQSVIEIKTGRVITKKVVNDLSTLTRENIDKHIQEKIDQDYFSQVKTISGLFQMIQNAIDKKANWIWIDYDFQRGFPTEIYIDDKKDVIDDEAKFTITDFEVIQ